ncbi:DNA-3-methyladenine glycosylase [Geminicoccus roseus]|uniref:DNA-3-methyladenine glycosylase n=1 Tax=Geminicoccus roseus TaxID=404900 RepID=UPI00196A1058|nr:DNA-3-methyladenine glycosylase [Geminicoccus roseus]
MSVAPPLAALPVPLPRSELPVDTVAMARWLLGKHLVHAHPEGLTSGRIVETEAYVLGDTSSHAHRGETQRNRSMFLGPGHAYVYFIYGSWFALNVSAEPAGIGAGVLIRAIEPIHGIPLMERRRGSTILHDLARGPGRLATAMAIDRTLDGMDLFGGGPLRLCAEDRPVEVIGESVRIGLSRETERVLRFFERGSRFVSGPKRLGR